MQPSDDRRARVKHMLSQRGLKDQPSSEQAAQSWVDDRFVARARALFYARMAFLTLGLFILAVPFWRSYFNFSPLAFGGYFFMLLYSVANYLVVEQRRVGRIFTYVTLCVDLIFMVIVLIKPHYGGGLQSPLLATQLLFTMLFALLFPRPIAILPPLLALPITIRFDQILNRMLTPIEVLTVIWYLALNLIVIYVLVYLSEREVAANREVVQLQSDLKDLAVIEERNRLAREIHDGLGASLSTLIIQAEYVSQIAKEAAVVDEISDLRNAAQEAIDELRRSLQMMREDFDLAHGIEDYTRAFGQRTQLSVVFTKSGQLETRMPSETALALFRMLQECLTNIAKHAQATRLAVHLDLSRDTIGLSVRDNGCGFDPAIVPRGHYGLVHLRERVTKLGGAISIDSDLGEGTAVQINVPVGTSASMESQRGISDSFT